MQESNRPLWLKKTVDYSQGIDITKTILKEFNLNTVCRSARCPNIFDCFSKKRATFLILGNNCTRNCGFCYIGKGDPEKVDEDEPDKIAEAAFRLGLRHIIITSVTRDDLADGGSTHFARTIHAIRKRFNRTIGIEVLVPDFKGNTPDINRVVEAGPDIFGHNVETVPRLYKRVRPGANYRQSINVLGLVKGRAPDLITKSALMLGLGERDQEVISVMKVLRKANCDMLAIGQYLRPSPQQVEVKNFISPEKFLMFKEVGARLGFKDVQSGPFVRSSYQMKT